MTAQTVEPIADGDALLRMLGNADLPATLAWRNDDSSRHWFLSSAIVTPEQHQAWFEAYRDRDDDYVFVLEVDGRAVAQAALSQVSDSGAEFGRLLVAPSERGRGLSHRIVSLVLRVADDVLMIPTVHLEVIRDNVAAIRSYEAAGFRADHGRAGASDSLVMVRTRP